LCSGCHVSPSSSGVIIIGFSIVSLRPELADGITNALLKPSLLSLDLVSVPVEHADATLVLSKIVAKLFLGHDEVFIGVSSAEWFKELEEADRFVVVDVNKTVEGHLSFQHLLNLVHCFGGARSVGLASAITVRVASSSGVSLVPIVPVGASEATATVFTEAFEILFFHLVIQRGGRIFLGWCRLEATLVELIVALVVIIVPGIIVAVALPIVPVLEIIVALVVPRVIVVLPLVLLPLATPAIAGVPSPSSVVTLIAIRLPVEDLIEVLFFIGRSRPNSTEFSQGAINSLLKVIESEFLLRLVTLIHCVVGRKDFLGVNFSILVRINQGEKSFCSLAARAQASAIKATTPAIGQSKPRSVRPVTPSIIYSLPSFYHLGLHFLGYLFLREGSFFFGFRKHMFLFGIFLFPVAE